MPECRPNKPSIRVLVLGLGNPLRGDDGVGCRVTEELARRELSPGVEVLDGGAGGLDLMDLMEGRERVVVVDAADVGRPAGEFVRFTPDQARLAQAADGFSLHHVGLGEVLALAGALGWALPEIVVFGVQPAELGWGEGLSPAVEAALPALSDAVVKEIEGDDNAQDSGD
jgi:hydrogenase maturation protease